MKTTLALCLGAVTALALPSDLSAQCATSGSTLTSYLGGNGQAGVMFDIVVGGADMTIECLDVNLRTGSGTYDVDVWYKSGTCVGSETNPAAWTLLKAFPATTPTGTNQATTLDLTGTGMVFAAGQTYGIYVHNPTYVTGNGPAYTNGGPTTYAGDHCDIVTYFGMSANWGSAFVYREFNGEAHTELAGPAGPSLTVASGTPGSSMSFDFANFTPNGNIAVVYGPAGSYTVPGGGCAGLVVDLLPMNFPPLASLILLGADANGDANLTRGVPGAASGLTLQAVDVASCTASNAVVL